MELHFRFSSCGGVDGDSKRESRSGRDFWECSGADPGRCDRTIAAVPQVMAPDYVRPVVSADRAARPLAHVRRLPLWCGGRTVGEFLRNGSKQPRMAGAPCWTVSESRPRRKPWDGAVDFAVSAHRDLVVLTLAPRSGEGVPGTQIVLPRALAAQRPGAQVESARCLLQTVSWTEVPLGKHWHGEAARRRARFSHSAIRKRKAPWTWPAAPTNTAAARRIHLVERFRDLSRCLLGCAQDDIDACALAESGRNRKTVALDPAVAWREVDHAASTIAEAGVRRRDAAARRARRPMTSYGRRKRGSHFSPTPRLAKRYGFYFSGFGQGRTQSMSSERSRRQRERSRKRSPKGSPPRTQ